LEMEVKHVVWADGESGGRLAVKEERGVIIIKKLAGNNLPANYLFAILDAAIPGWRQEAEELHLGRRNAWFVETRQGRWGSTTFLLKVIRDVELIDIPTVACLHVSCVGKLTDRIELWLGDLAPLAAALKKSFPQAVLPPEEEEGYFPFWCETPEGGYLKIRVEEPRFVGLDQGVRLPGEPSGLLDPQEPEEQPQVPEIEVI
jgi:hypothetical protein